MDGFIDIHSHLLPGIDDGPRDLDAALEMARSAAESGTGTLVSTPHLRSDFPAVHVEEIADRCRAMAEAARAAGITLNIVPGAETSLAWALDASDEALAAATYGGRGTDLLIETPDDVSMLEALLFQVRVRGVRVTLAHPERSASFQRDPAAVERLADQQVLLQVNAGALMAKPGSAHRRLAEHLCRTGIAHALASDGHRARDWRPVSALGPGVQALAGLVGEARADWMSRAAPGAIIAGEPLPEPPEIRARSRSLWSRLRR